MGTQADPRNNQLKAPTVTLGPEILVRSGGDRRWARSQNSFHITTVNNQKIFDE